MPTVVGQPLGVAQAKLAAQPLEWTLAYQPARALQRVDRVIAQVPQRGHLSSYDKVTLILPKAQHGVIPKVVGLTLRGGANEAPADRAPARRRRVHRRPAPGGSSPRHPPRGSRPGRG